MSIIKPTVGRKVWYRPSAYDQAGPGGMQVAGEQPLDATIVAVWGDRMVNLLVVDASAKTHQRLSVTLKQGDDEDRIAEGQAYAEWMPYQKDQAQKDAGSAA